MSIYDRFDKTAKKLINKFDTRAEHIQLLRNACNGVSAVTGEFVEGGGNYLDVRGVVSTFNESQINNTTILTGDLQVILDSTVEPLKSDTVIIDNKNYSIILIDTVRPADKTILYTLQVRR